MGPNNATQGVLRTKIAAIAITKGMICKLTTAADTVTPCTATTDGAIYVAQEDIDAAARGTFAAFTPAVQHRVLIASAVTRGDKLQIDASNVGNLKTRSSGIGVAVAEETGTAGATILVIPCFTET